MSNFDLICKSWLKAKELGITGLTLLTSFDYDADEYNTEFVLIDSVLLYLSRDIPRNHRVLQALLYAIWNKLLPHDSGYILELTDYYAKISKSGKWFLTFDDSSMTWGGQCKAGLLYDIHSAKPRKNGNQDPFDVVAALEHFEKCESNNWADFGFC
jgi:hypothetical protein